MGPVRFQMLDLSESNHVKVQFLCGSVRIIAGVIIAIIIIMIIINVGVTYTFVQKRLLCFLHTAGGGQM